MDDLLNVFDFQARASERIDKPAWDYYRSGAGDEVTLRENRAAFDRISLHYRVLVDVSRCSTGTTVLGSELTMPILVAPTAFHKLAHPEGEIATAKAAGGAGTAMILSTLSTTPVEEVMAAATGPVWFQLYVYRDRAATEALVRRVEAAGVSALVLTVDAPRLGRRERDERNHFSLPPELAVANVLADGLGKLPEGEGSGLASYFASLLDPTLSWKDLDWLVQLTDLPVLVKGVVRADDAARAVEHGAAGVVVSNHGGRQLDTSPATIDVLPSIVEAIDGRAEVLVDGGVRRGIDVVKALALGASSVLIGRPILWGLGVGGASGVGRVLSLLREETELAMMLCGCPSVADVDATLVHPER